MATISLYAYPKGGVSQFPPTTELRDGTTFKVKGRRRNGGASQSGSFTRLTPPGSLRDITQGKQDDEPRRFVNCNLASCGTIKGAVRAGGGSLESDDRIVVVGGQTNPYHMVANMRYAVSLSIDKWA